MNALRAILEWVREQPVLTILVLLLVFLLAVFVTIGVSDPACIYRFFGVEKGTEKFRILEFVGVGMGGILLAIGATIAYRRAKAMEKAANAQAKAVEAQAEATAQQAAANRGAEDGRRQERLKNAIEHLGHESDSVRLGGAYELFHLARDTEDLRQTVMDILCAHVRWTTGEDGYREKHKSKPSTEIQSLLTLLFRQEHEVFRGCPIDLQESWLNGADLSRARLQEASLSGVELRGAILLLAQLQSASLPRAQLQGADLTGVELQEANLSWAELQEANLSWAELQGVNLSEAQLQSASLPRAQLQSASLSGAQLQGANLFGVQLQEAILSEAQLQGANLNDAQLQSASLSGAQLQGANLYRAQLQGASLSGTKLQGITCQVIEYPSFKEYIHDRIGWESDLSGATFAGGLIQGSKGLLIPGVSDKQAERLQLILQSHIDQPASNELPEDSGAIIGKYTKEEAERWIAEYEEAMRGVPKADG